MNEKLRVGVYQPSEIPQSFKVYAANVACNFAGKNIELIPFNNSNDLPRTADVLWDIRAGGGNPPLEFLMGGPPLVMTVYGFAPISLPGREYFRSIPDMILSGHYARKKLKQWKELKDGVSSVITISNFTKNETVELTGIPANKITVCHLGVNSKLFTYDPAVKHDNYFLHISNDEPRKNVARIVAAFRRLRKNHDVKLLLKLPPQQASRYQGIDGVEVIASMLSSEELASLYRRALGFVFPSLYEGFGLPILEAMACGCPVITSNASACPEVAGDAALITDPRNVDDITQAMQTLLMQRGARERFVARGLQRITPFNWPSSSDCHAKVLRAASEKN